jgi:hypothetical protein
VPIKVAVPCLSLSSTTIVATSSDSNKTFHCEFSFIELNILFEFLLIATLTLDECHQCHPKPQVS